MLTRLPPKRHSTAEDTLVGVSRRQEHAKFAYVQAQECLVFELEDKHTFMLVYTPDGRASSTQTCRGRRDLGAAIYEMYARSAQRVHFIDHTIVQSIKENLPSSAPEGR